MGRRVEAHLRERALHMLDVIEIPRREPDPALVVAVRLRRELAEQERTHHGRGEQFLVRQRAG